MNEVKYPEVTMPQRPPEKISIPMRGKNCKRMNHL